MRVIEVPLQLDLIPDLPQVVQRQSGIQYMVLVLSIILILKKYIIVTVTPIPPPAPPDVRRDGQLRGHGRRQRETDTPFFGVPPNGANGT